MDLYLEKNDELHLIGPVFESSVCCQLLYLLVLQVFISKMKRITVDNYVRLFKEWNLFVLVKLINREHSYFL